MPHLTDRVRRLSDAAWRLRRGAPTPEGSLPPFALVLFTDDRRQPDVTGLLEHLPPAGVIPPLAVLFRHDALPRDERRRVATQAMAAVHARGHLFILARGHLPGAEGIHASPDRRAAVITWPVHSIREAREAAAAGADAVFISPVFPTASHPGAPSLGPARAATLARVAGRAAFALGGMTAATSRRLVGLPFHGLGAIGAWSG